MPKINDTRTVKFRPFIEEWREYRGFTQDGLAERSGVSKGLISQLQSGKSLYTHKTLEALAEAFACTPGEVLDVNPLIADPLTLAVVELRQYPDLIPAVVGYIRGEVNAAERAKGAAPKTEANNQDRRRNRPSDAAHDAGQVLQAEEVTGRSARGKKPASEPAKPEARKSRL